MLLLLLTSLLIAIGLAITLTSNPASLSIWLILITLIIALILNATSSRWFALILFLIYIGGILVIFSYFTVIQPNQHLEMNKIIISSGLASLLLLLLHFNFLKPLFLSSNSLLIPSFILIIPLTLNILLILGLIIFLALVATVKISKLPEGPLRPFSYVTTYT